MESILKSLDRNPLRKEPRIWVSRIVIYEQLEPKPIVIRDIPLTRGLNIISAEEASDTSQTGLIHGHSAGKTTLCRFIRYLLGESTFAPDKTTAMIKCSFPQGWIAGELNVLGKKWTVMRSMGGRSSHAVENISLDQFIKMKGAKLSQAKYVEVIGFPNLLDDLAVKSIVQTDENINWGHVLSWCSRDQEARLANLHEWRVSSSNSGAPKFLKPKEGPLYTMRALMSLLQDSEVKLQQKIGAMEKELSNLSKHLELKKQEPIIVAETQKAALRSYLKEKGFSVDDLSYASDDLTMSTLSSISQDRCKHLQQNLSELEHQKNALQKELGLLQEQKGKINQQIEPLDIQLELYRDQLLEIEGKERKSKEELEVLREKLDSLCVWGNIAVKNCSYFNKKNLSFDDFRDSNNDAKNADLLCKLLDELEEKKTPLVEQFSDNNAEIKHLQDKMFNYRQKYEKLLIEKDQLHRLIETIDSCHAELKHPTASMQLKLLTDKYKQLDRQILEDKSKLNVVRRDFEKNSELLSQIFSLLISNLLPSLKATGRVTLEQGDIAFNIIQGQILGGEAISTLSILLADLSCLIYNTLHEKSCLPDFLLHDSPREADMGGYLYSNYLRLAASLQNEFGSNCPFQYIVTTTTPPPVDLKKHVVLQLGTYPESELLLKRQLKEDHQQAKFM